MSNELKHHGILGMKWGVRRFQNKDGSLTLAGRKRLHESEENEDPKKQEKAWHQQDKGYDAIVDAQDFVGYFVDYPVILLNPGKDTKVKEVRRLFVDG